MTTPYAMDLGWPALLRQLNIRTGDVLRRAGLPDDLFARPSARLDSAAYFRFWEALEAEAAEHPEPLALRLYSAVRGELFSPALFAALCSPNLAAALQRLAKFKTLIAPQRLDLDETERSITVTVTWLDASLPPPPSFVVADLLFFVVLARMGTHERVSPLRFECPSPPGAPRAFEHFLGVPITRGRRCAVTFAASDAQRPFLSSSESMWSIFEPELQRRAAELDSSATTRDRVRACLLEALPAGEVTMEGVARRLALSKRTLQRRLEEEGTTFQQVLRETREALALNYLRRTSVPFAEISFLLGFADPNSFFRAFNDWTGQTPETIRRQHEAAPSLLQ